MKIICCNFFLQINVDPKPEYVSVQSAAISKKNALTALESQSEQAEQKQQKFAKQQKQQTIVQTPQQVNQQQQDIPKQLKPVVGQQIVAQHPPSQQTASPQQASKQTTSTTSNVPTADQVTIFAFIQFFFPLTLLSQWPPSLKLYVQRSFARCESDAQRINVEKELKRKITEAIQNKQLQKDWQNEPLPPLPPL